MDRTINKPDVSMDHPVRLAELKLVEPAERAHTGTKPVKEIQTAEDVEDMWDNLPV